MTGGSGESSSPPADAFAPSAVAPREWVEAERAGVAYRSARWTPDGLGRLAAHLATTGAEALAALGDDRLLAAWGDAVAAFRDPESPERRRLDARPRPHLPAVAGGAGRRPRGGARRGRPRARRPRPRRRPRPPGAAAHSGPGDPRRQPARPGGPAAAPRPRPPPAGAPQVALRGAALRPRLRRRPGQPRAGARRGGGRRHLAGGRRRPRSAAPGRRRAGRRLRRAGHPRRPRTPRPRQAPRLRPQDQPGDRRGRRRPASGRRRARPRRRALRSARLPVGRRGLHRRRRRGAGRQARQPSWPSWPTAGRPAPPTSTAAAAVRQLREEAALRGLLHWEAAPRAGLGAGTVVLEPDPGFRPTPGLRTVRVHPLAGPRPPPRASSRRGRAGSRAPPWPARRPGPSSPPSAGWASPASPRRASCRPPTPPGTTAASTRWLELADSVGLATRRPAPLRIRLRASSGALQASPSMRPTSRPPTQTTAVGTPRMSSASAWGSPLNGLGRP